MRMIGNQHKEWPILEMKLFSGTFFTELIVEKSYFM